MLALAGCAAAPPDTVAPSGSDTVKVFKSRAAEQCGSRGTAPEAMRVQLEQAGVRVSSIACGSDGRQRPAVCGAATGEINLFDIAVADLARAEALGFAPLSTLRGQVEVVPCR